MFFVFANFPLFNSKQSTTIKKQTGASIQVASEMLPGSTERAVTVSGKLDSIVECFKLVSVIMLEVCIICLFYCLVFEAW